MFQCKPACLALLVVAVVGCGPDYATSLQTYKTELEIYDRLVADRKAMADKQQGELSHLASMNSQLANTPGFEERSKQVLELEKGQKAILSDLDTQIAEQLSRVEKARDVLKTAEKGR